MIAIVIILEEFKKSKLFTILIVDKIDRYFLKRERERKIISYFHKFRFQNLKIRFRSISIFLNVSTFHFFLFLFLRLSNSYSHNHSSFVSTQKFLLVTDFQKDATLKWSMHERVFSQFLIRNTVLIISLLSTLIKLEKLAVISIARPLIARFLRWCFTLVRNATVKSNAKLYLYL